MNKKHDLFYVLSKLREKGINPRFLSLVEEEFKSTKTLSEYNLYQLRKTTYATLNYWFNPDWANHIPIIDTPSYRRIRSKGDPDCCHIFYKKPGRKSD